MSLKVLIPGTTGTLKNQGLLQLPSPSYNATSEVTSGKLGKGIQGLVCYHLSSDPCPSLWSVACWSKFTSGYSTYNNIILCLNTADSEDSKFYLSIINNTNLNIGRGASGTVSYSLPGNFLVDTWYHLAATFDGTTTKLYLNGSLVNSSTGGSTKSALNLTIGGRSTNTNGTSTTGVGWATNDVRIYDHCLTPQEVKEISKGLVAHYTLGSADVLPAITNYASNSGPNGWNNSGNASRNSNETTYGKPLGNLPVYSITTTTAGEQCITFGNIGSTNATTLRGKLITASCWIYIVGSNIYNSTPYLRSSKYDNTIASFKYNGNGSIQLWPKNKWIRIEGTGTIASDETDAYFCNYLGNSGEIRAFSGWQVENYGIATPRIAPGTSRSTGIVYDSSGYCRNGVISGTISPADSVRYDKSIYMDGTSAINIGNVATYVPDGNLTVNLWFYKDSYSSKSYDTVFGGPSGFEIETKPHASNEPDRHICPHNWETDHTANTEIPYEFNKWNMLTMVRTSSNSKWYLNGELKRTLNSATIPSGDYFIGAWRSATEQNFKGRVSDCRIFATALSADDVKDLYNLGASIS